MNILRTIPRDQQLSWVELLFVTGPHKGNRVPKYPPSFPLAGKLREHVKDSFLYLVFREKVIGYGKIADIIPHHGSEVGSDGRFVPPGDELVLAGPLKPMPFTLPCASFRRFRYTTENLHQLDHLSAEKEIRVLGLALA